MQLHCQKKKKLKDILGFRISHSKSQREDSPPWKVGDSWQLFVAEAQGTGQGVAGSPTCLRSGTSKVDRMAPGFPEGLWAARPQDNISISEDNHPIQGAAPARRGLMVAHRGRLQRVLQEAAIDNLALTQGGNRVPDLDVVTKQRSGVETKSYGKVMTEKAQVVHYTSWDN